MAHPLILGIIPARGGSKGIPRKNIKPLGGKPLLAWTIEAALEAGCLDRLILTTEDEEIAAVGREYGCEVPFLRPAELAQDATPGIEPILHAVQWLSEQEGYHPDYVLLLQPTSPFRTAGQIRDCVARVQTTEFESASFDALVSVTEPEHPPEWMFRQGEDGVLRPLLGSERAPRRQELPPAWALNGALYITRTEVLLRERTFLPERVQGFLMDRTSSLDLDTPWDWQLAECYLKLGMA